MNVSRAVLEAIEAVLPSPVFIVKADYGNHEINFALFDEKEGAERKARMYQHHEERPDSVVIEEKTRQDAARMLLQHVDPY